MPEYTIEAYKTGFMSWWVDAYRGRELVAVQRHTPYATKGGAIRGMKKYLRDKYGPSQGTEVHKVTYHV